MKPVPGRAVCREAYEKERERADRERDGCIKGRAKGLEAGDALVAPAGVEHGLVNDGDTRLLVVVLVTPPPPHA